MPYIIRHMHESQELSDAQIERLLWNEDSTPTLPGQVLSDFLYEHVDWSDLFDSIVADEELADAVVTTDSNFREAKNGDWIECDEDHEEAIPWPVEELDGAIVAEEVDMDDLVECFQMWVNDLPEDTLASKTAKRVAEELLYGSDEDDVADIEEDQIDEKSGFRKGAFRQMRKKGAGAQVNRMLGAMLQKGVITRAKKPGKGYRKGDYAKNPAGYPTGTPKGVKKWKKYKTGKGKAAVAKAERKARGAKSRAGQGKKKKKRRVRSDVNAPSANLTEGRQSFGPSLAGKIVGRKPVTEDKE